MASRLKVLRCFKDLHKARKSAFHRDEELLEAGRKKINEEFLKNKVEGDLAKVNELIKVAEDAAVYLRTMVVQGKWNEEKEVYEVELREDTHLWENKVFDGELLEKDSLAKRSKRTKKKS